MASETNNGNFFSGLLVGTSKLKWLVFSLAFSLSAIYLCSEVYYLSQFPTPSKTSASWYETSNPRNFTTSFDSSRGSSINEESIKNDKARDTLEKKKNFTTSFDPSHGSSINEESIRNDKAVIQKHPFRFIALCSCPYNHGESDYAANFGVDWALKKIAHWFTEIEYVGMHTTSAVEKNKSSCEDFIESQISARLQESKGLKSDDIANTTTVIEVIYSSMYSSVCEVDIRPLNTTFVGLNSEMGVPAFNRNVRFQNITNTSSFSFWDGGFHIPAHPSPSTQAMISSHNVRFIHDWSEVDHARGIKCHPYNAQGKTSKQDSTINFYRSRILWDAHQNEHCAVIHYPTIFRWASAISDRKNSEEKKILNNSSQQDEDRTKSMISMLTHQRTKEEARQILQSKSYFAILVTMTTFKLGYDTDALVRHALCRLLNEKYKPCFAIHSWKGIPGEKEQREKHNVDQTVTPLDTYKIQGQFKFAITMPNKFNEGYLVEKTIHPYLAGSVAITTSPNIGKYVNADGMITCRIPESELEKVRRYYRGDFLWMPFNTTHDMWKKNDIQPVLYDPFVDQGKGDEAVLKFVASAWENALQPCIDEIIRVDKDDEVYVQKLVEPYVRNGGQQSMFDGTYVGLSLLKWLMWANSPLVKGLESRINLIEGMREQTQGSGFPGIGEYNL